MKRGVALAGSVLVDCAFMILRYSEIEMTMGRFWIVMLALLIPLPLWGAGRAPVLENILEQVRESYNKQERPMVIFDVDGTLLDNRTRIQKILQEYASAELKKIRPNDAKKIMNVTLDQIQYRVADTLKAIGVEGPGIANNATVFWGERFFSDEYLAYDAATVGVVDFVRTLYSSGAKIVYLTGRDTERQLMGTVRSLREHGFPIGIQGTELIMKPTPQTQNAIFKQRVTNYLRHYGKVIAAFDNEPGNINVYRRAFGKSICVLFEASHSGDAPPLLPNITMLSSFELLPETAPINVVPKPIDAAAKVQELVGQNAVATPENTGATNPEDTADASGEETEAEPEVATETPPEEEDPLAP